MLIEFRVSNYRSICEEQVISLVPSPKQKDFPTNIINHEGYDILNGLALYGANSSGKSNLLKSLELLDKLLYLSARSSSITKLPYDPFLLKEGYSIKPTKLEIVFVIEKTRYRYGLEFNRTEIVSEWLFRKRVGREVELFNRAKDIIEVSSGFKGSQKLIDTAIEATRDNALFLSFCDTFNIKEANLIFKWFNKFVIIDGLNTEKESIQTINLWEEPEYQNKIREYLIQLDLGFKDLVLNNKEFDPSELPEGMDEAMRQSIKRELTGKTGVQINTVHETYDKEGNLTTNDIVWPMEERESEGTKKAIHFSGPIIYALIKGGVLVIDEIEAKIHPSITLSIIELFLSHKLNPNNAQLIFASHDTNLLHYSHLRRDQINFVEKNSFQGTEIYALSDFRYFNNQAERSDVDKEKRYLEGRYGAVPVLGQLNQKINDWYGQEG